MLQVQYILSREGEGWNAKDDLSFIGNRLTERRGFRKVCITAPMGLLKWKEGWGCEFPDDCRRR